MRSFQTGDTTLPDWAKAFDAEVAQALEQRDARPLAHSVETDVGKHVAPVDRSLPPAALRRRRLATRDDAVSFPLMGWDGGSLSMRSVRFG